MPTLPIRKKFLWFLLLLNLTVLPLIYWRTHPKVIHGAADRREADLPVYGQMPNFTLVRENSSPFTNQQMTGGPWVVDFIFTRCPGQCPMMSSKFALLQKSLPAGVRLASFSVDATYDTPEKLSAYAKKFHADPVRWVFLTGDKALIAGIREALHLGGEDDPNMHSLRFVLLDNRLQIRGYYDAQETESLKKISQDIKKLGERS